MEAWAPLDLAENWDNVGLQLGEPSFAIRHVCIALDVDESTIEYLHRHDCDLVITHHPLFFKPLRYIRYHSDIGKILNLFFKKNISLLSYHTNLDRAKNGVNDCLINAYSFDANQSTPFAKFGKYVHNLPNYSLDDLAAMHNCRVLNFSSKSIPEKIAFCGGSGHGLIPYLYNEEIDCFITGEITYHDEVFCQLHGISVLLLGHRESEVGITKEIAKYLHKFFPQISLSYIDLKRHVQTISSYNTSIPL